MANVIQIILRGKDEASKVISGFAGSLTSNMQKVGAITLGAGAAVAGAAAGVGVAVGKMAMDAAPVEGLASAFEGLTTSVGVGADDMMAALKRGSSGMIAQRDLMESFNKAASLVSLDFAVELPEAMQYLSKVSASTGADMGYLMDSLVTGVGRMSPMILDNLAIQVSLSEATERAAEMFGVEADALSDAQQQAGMMSVVLEKLKTNTAAMPDVTGSAAEQMAQLKATFQDTKDEVGLAFLPVLNALLGTVQEVGGVVLPLLTSALAAITPFVQSVAEAFSFFISALLSGEDPIAALTIALYKFLPPEIAQPIIDAIRWIRDGVQAIIDVVGPYVDMAMVWIGENVKVTDVLLGLGIAVMTVVVPALWALLSPLIPIIATALAVIAVVALLRAAWESDFLGIRTALIEAWDNIRPALELLWEWLQTNIPAAISTLKTFFEDTLLPAFQAAWGFIQENLIPILDALGELVGTALVLAGTALAGLWQNVLLPALQAAGSWISDTFGPILDAFLGWLNRVTGGLDGVKNALSGVKDWITNVSNALKSVSLPSWLTPGSPTPFELGLRGIGDAMKGLSSTQLPKLDSALDLRTPQLGTAGVAGGRIIHVTNNFGAGSVRSDRDIRRIQEDQERSLRLRGLGAIA